LERHPALRDLSRDHHLLLVHAQRMTRAVEAGPKETLAAAKAFLDYWSGAGAYHLEEEMRFVVPATPESSLQGRYNMLEEGLRNAVDQVRITLMDPQFFRESVMKVVPLLRSHVNFCEATLFEDVEDNLGEAGLAKLGAEMTKFRRDRRPGSIGTQRSEPCYLDNVPPMPA
jgi:hypothetical protein